MTDDVRPPGPRPRFRRRTDPIGGAADPEALFGELPRTPGGVGALWSHQADQLRSYAEKHAKTPDVALELPTGSGKTLVGLLVAEWRRRTLAQRVVYACPTKQLAAQVAQKAADQGIPAVLLVGSHRDWSPADVGRYTRGDAIAVTTYSGIFNWNSHLADAHTLVFDDAHAAEGYVAEAWALSVPRTVPQYDQLFEALREAIDPTFIARMVAPDSAAADANEIRLIPIAAVAAHVGDIDAVLSGLAGRSVYRFRMLRENLASCLFYAARREFYIRPMIPPTFAHRPFTDPSQRIYLSASLGDAGELERAFGRSTIQRIPVPPAWDRAGSGRRFFVFPDLAPAQHSSDPDGETPSQSHPSEQLVDGLLGLSPKRLILTPSEDAAVAIADRLGVPSADRYTAKDGDTIEPFLRAATGTLLAPSRYDGMDLADNSCRLMLLAGLPLASHLQDRFLETKLRAGEVLQERIRTRVLQGAGRCTRGPKDWAVVVVQGEDILRFLSRAEVRKSLPAELQAEISFGLEQSQADGETLTYLAESALTQDQVWQEDAEPELARLRREASRAPQPNVTELRESTHREVTAWRHAWSQDWEAAARAAVDVLDHLTAPGLRSYRAFWAYFGSAWSALAADGITSAAAVRSEQLLREAHAAAVGTTWLKEVQPVSSPSFATDATDEDGVQRAISLLAGRYGSSTKLDRDTAAMLAALTQQAATEYEQGLVALGQFLGAESYKPAGKGRADAAWVWASLWITIEAKSGQEAHGVLSMDYVRQANTQLASLASDREADAAPVSSISVIVSPRAIVDPDAVPIAAAHVHLAAPKLVLDLAHGAVRAWRELRGLAKGITPTDSHEVAKVLWEHRLLPSQVRERLSLDPVRGS